MDRGYRRTRSQAAPDWTAQESLTLVNEVKAVEAECGSTMPSFQKWQLTVEHCNALDVFRSMDQCKRKWDSLLEDYRKVKPLESQYRIASLNDDHKKELGLQADFNLELFEAIDKYVKKQGKNASGVDTDMDSDPEAQADDSILPGSGGSKKQCRRSNTQKHRLEGALPSWRYASSGSTKQEQPSLLDDKVEPPQNMEAEQSSGEDKTEMMALTLQKNAELINAIVEGDLTRAVGDDTDLVRLQADKLIDCLGKFSETLGQLCEMVQECK